MKVDLLISYGLGFLGVPYKFGGDSFLGFDCSGFVQECLASQGLDPKGRQNCQMLYAHFKTRAKEIKPKKGALLFFGLSTASLTHIAFAYDEELMLECGGGDASTKSAEQANIKRAMVRIRPIRLDLVSSLDLNTRP